MSSKRDIAIQREFSRWSKSYGKSGPPGIKIKKNFSKIHLKRQKLAIKNLDVKKGQKIIDVACGVGKSLPILSKKVGINGKVVGIDITKKMIDRSRERTKRLENVLLKRCGVDKIPFKTGYFDGVMCTNAFHHFYKPVSMLREIKRIMKKGGRIVIIDTNRDIKKNADIDIILRDKEKGHHKFFSSKEMRDLFKRVGFCKIKLFKDGPRFLIVGQKK
jgi:ubiquinone/menaquinone biosynthesis C-methylase UbiE